MATFYIYMFYADMNVNGVLQTQKYGILSSKKAMANTLDNSAIVENQAFDYDFNVYKRHFEANNISFGTVRRLNGLNLAEDTGFFRDLGTLNKSVETLRTNFPNGATILDYACSDGEESLSLLGLLASTKNSPKCFLNKRKESPYDIMAYDISYDMIFKARVGQYSIIPGYWDNFLCNPFSLKLTSEEREAVNIFRRIMKKDKDSLYAMNYNNSLSRRNGEISLPQRIYSVRNEYSDKIKYGVGSIEDIDKVLVEKPVGAVFFRNAFYHLFRPEYENSGRYKEMSGAEKISKAQEIIGKIDDVLAPGGIFVMGDIPLEHVFEADDTVENKDKTSLTDEFGEADYQIPMISGRSYIFKVSPVEKALIDKGYKRIYSVKCPLGERYDNGEIIKKEVTTIWQKPY